MLPVSIQTMLLWARKGRDIRVCPVDLGDNERRVFDVAEAQVLPPIQTTSILGSASPHRPVIGAVQRLDSTLLLGQGLKDPWQEGNTEGRSAGLGARPGGNPGS